MTTKHTLLVTLLLAISCGTGSDGTQTPSTTDVPDSDGDDIPDSLDCDPTDADIYDGAPENGVNDVDEGDGKDNDCDGTVDEGTHAFDDDGDGFSEDGGDCIDTDSSISPAEVDIPYDGIDQNCNGEDLIDIDNDGFPGIPAEGLDCDDTDNTIYPSASEDGGAGNNLGDDKDNDCDEVIDEGMLDTDDDKDGFSENGGDCDDGDIDISPNAVEIPYDGIDQDCLGGDLTDVDQDGQDSTDIATGTDCNDNDADIYEGAFEACDGKDNNCDEIVPSDEVEQLFFADVDQDGYGDSEVTFTALACEAPANTALEGGDCDDNNAEINPSATEVCDGEDTDCNPDTDENEGPTVYPDNDEDGYGDGGNPSVSSLCEPSDNTVENGDDCDDDDSDVNPEQSEICDGKDNDCNAETLENSGPILYPDGDLDGFGDEDNPVVDSICTPQSDAIVTGGDCDDGDAEVYPGAPEICDGKDNDCNAETIEGVDTDLDGDGVSACDELGAVLDCDDLNAQVAPGKAEWRDDGLDNDCDGTVDNEMMAHDLRLYYAGNEENSHFARSMDGTEDLDGDGWNDLVIGVPRQDVGELSDAGQVWIQAGLENATSGGDGSIGAQIFSSDEAISYMGYNVSVAPDINGDDLPDILVGIPRSDEGGFNRGALFIQFGDESGQPESLLNSEADVYIYSESSSAYKDLGSQVKGLGDINGDGLGDFAVSGYDRVLIYFGRESWPSAMDDDNQDGDDLLGPDITLSGFLAGDGGEQVSISSGDLDADGKLDLFIGDRDADNRTGRVYVWWGEQGIIEGIADQTAHLILGGEVLADELGQAVDVSEDLNHDGIQDLVVSAPAAKAKTNLEPGYAGRIYVLLGRSTSDWQSFSGLMGDADQIFAGSNNNEQAGTTLKSLPDITGDDISDLAVFSLNNDNSGTFSVLAGWDGPWEKGTQDVSLHEMSVLTIYGDASSRSGEAISYTGNHGLTDNSFAFSAYLSDIPELGVGQLFLMEGREEAPTPEPSPTPSETPTSSPTPEEQNTPEMSPSPTEKSAVPN